MSDASHPAPPLELALVTAGYDHSRPPVLSNLSLRIDPKGLTVVRGRNGCGKSTLLELVTGYLRPWSGEVRVAGHPAHSDPARRHRLACRTQPALYPAMTVAEHLEFACLCRGEPPDAASERAHRLGLEEWMNHEASELSTGNTRKLWLLMNTLGTRPLLVLDEPFNGLDPESVALVCADIASWAEDRAVLLIAHQLPAALDPTTVVTLTGAPLTATEPVA